MHKIVFYSWQSDLPNSANRGFIQKALEKAAAAITVDDAVDIEPVIDRDTKGVAGSPDIAATIFGKISAANVFVADVSIVCRQEGGRATPNPNVLIELGYAIKALGHEKIILIFNQSFGKIEDLPFDLRTRRLTVYNVSVEMAEKATEKNKLQKQLEDAICAAIANNTESDSNDSSLGSVLNAIENEQANRIIVTRRILGDFFSKITALEPKKARDGGTVEDLLTAIDKTQELVADFSKISEAVAIMDDEKCASEIIKWFGSILEGYNLASDFSGSFSEADFDYFKFVGHELIVTFIAFLLKENRWILLEHVLNEPIVVSYFRNEGGPVNLDIKYISSYVYLLDAESKKTHRVSVHADKLHHRHTEGGLSAILPFEFFVSADFFLFLFSKLSSNNQEEGSYSWYPRSIVYMKSQPLFVINASKIRVAEQLAKTFGLKDVNELKNKLKEIIPEIHKLIQNGFWRCPISEDQINKIGTS